MILSNYRISIKQVLDYNDSKDDKIILNDNRLWSILLATLHSEYRCLLNGIYLNDDNNLSCENVYLKSNGEIELDINDVIKLNNHNDSRYHLIQKKYIYSLGCLLSYLISLTNIQISSELRSIVALMVDEVEDLSLTYLFEAVYKHSCIHLNEPYQKEIQYLYETTLQNILNSNNLNILTSESVKSIDTKITNDRINSSSNDSLNWTSIKLNNEPLLNVKKFITLVEKIKKRRKRLNTLRKALNIQFDNNSEDEINDLNEIVNYVLLLKQTNNQNVNDSVSAKQVNDDTINQSNDNYLTNNRIQKIYDIRRIPPLLKFDDAFENGRKDLINVAVKLITESKFEFKCSSQSSIKQIFEYIIAYLDLSEQNLFGLFIYYENYYYFVDSDEKISKIALKWRRKDQAKDSIELYFKIKIYLNDITLLHHSLTLQFYYWELRRQFTNGHYNDYNNISDDDDQLSSKDELPTIFKLAVLAFHAEGGDINEFNYLYDNYVPEKHLTEISLFENQVIEYFKLISSSQTIFDSLMKFISVILLSI